MEELKQLISKRDGIEEEIEYLNRYLTGPGMPGLQGGLVDKEGFPIDDVQLIISVREARNKLACLQNDHKNLMKEIEEKMLNVHAVAREQKTVVAGNEEFQKIRNEIDEMEGKTPIAQVGEVSDDSPASRAGLQVGDVVLKFGTVEYSASAGNNMIPIIGKMVADSEGKNVPLFVRRHVGGGVYQVKKLVITPQKWKGKGLVGCFLGPYKG